MTRTLYYFLSLCFLIHYSLDAQGLTEKYASFDIGLGVGAIDFGDYNNLCLQFSENSIRELEYNFDHTLESSSYFPLILQLKFGKYEGLSHSVFFDLPLQGKGIGKFGYSIGYNFAQPIGIYDLLIRPSVAISSGEASYHIDNFQVDTIGIILKDTDYIDTEVDMRLSENATLITPGLELSFLIEQKIAVWVKASYDIPISDQSESFIFSANDYDSTKLDYTDSFQGMTVNGDNPPQEIFSFSPVIWSFGVSTYYNRE